MNMRAYREELVRQVGESRVPVSLVGGAQRASLIMGNDNIHLRLKKIQDDLHIEIVPSFLSVVGIDRVMDVEATADLHTVQLQVVTACSKFGLELICDPQVFYRDTFPYRMVFMFELPKPVSKVVTLTLNVDLEV